MSEFGQEQEQEEPTSMHDAFQSAFDDDDNAEVVPDPAIVESPKEERAPESSAEPITEEPIDEPVESKPPQSWGVAEREGWKDIPPQIQNQISKREAETQQVLMQSGEARKFQQQFQQAVTPFVGFIQAEGSTPMNAVGELLQTAATLQAGAPQQKATRMAELINHYGIDIGMLDTILSGQVPQENDETRLGQMLDQRLQPMMSTLNQFQQSQQNQVQQSHQQTHTQIGEFMAQNEFAKDVKFEMADMMEMAGKRNQVMTLDDAYKKALLLRPDIQEVIFQRQAGLQAKEGNQSVAEKRHAAGSIPGGSAMQTGPSKPGSMREHLEAAING